LPREYFIENTLLDWLGSNQQYALFLIPILAFIEACIGIGLFVSGIFLLVVATASYTNQLAPIELIVPLAFAGAFLGDHAGFYIGRLLGPHFNHSAFATRYQSSIDRAELNIRKYGSAVIFVGRFLPAIRSIIPAMLGLSGFDPLRYLLFDAVACVLWALALGAIVLGLDLGLSFGST
jgi:membrane-associated protein